MLLLLPNVGHVYTSRNRLGFQVSLLHCTAFQSSVSPHVQVYYILQRQYSLRFEAAKCLVVRGCRSHCQGPSCRGLHMEVETTSGENSVLSSLQSDESILIYLAEWSRTQTVGCKPHPTTALTDTEPQFKQTRIRSLFLHGHALCFLYVTSVTYPISYSLSTGGK